MRLTDLRWKGSLREVKALIFNVAICGVWMAGGILQGQTPEPADSGISESVVTAEPVPAEVVTSAIAAVNRLGNELVQGRFQAAVVQMYPAWKASIASRMGGMKELETKFAQISSEMARQGSSVISCAAQGTPVCYEVAPGIRKVMRGNKSTEILAHTKWLILVPTVTRFRMTHTPPGQPARVVMVESTSFQAAISEKSALAWTFIDGATLTPHDLRSLFGTLPANLQLPAVSKREVR